MELQEAIKIAKNHTELIDKFSKRGIINEVDKKANEAVKVLIKNLSLSGVVKSSYCYAVNEHEGKCQQQCLGCSMKQRRLGQ